MTEVMTVRYGEALVTTTSLAFDDRNLAEAARLAQKSFKREDIRIICELLAIL